MIAACADGNRPRRTPSLSVIPQIPENIVIITDTSAMQHNYIVPIGDSPSEETSAEEEKVGVATIAPVLRCTRRRRKRSNMGVVLPSPRQSELHHFAIGDDILKLIILEEEISEGHPGRDHVHTIRAQ